MPISKAVLGMNARNFLYIRKFNPLWAKRVADDKLETKKLLIENDIQTTALIHVFETRDSIREYNWNLPEEGFVLKPARGYGGEGIIVFKSFKNREGISVSDQTYNINQLESHILDIFEGVYSLQSLPDKAFIENRIYPHPFFKKYAPLGLPDIRVIVFNKVPVMAMARLPNEESKGKANLHLGAVAAGIDIRTGITNHAIHKDRTITFLPGTKIKARGIKIPYWDEILRLSVKTQNVSGLGYVGVDLVLDAHKGPMVLEINARPGLSIQNANLSSLRSRLERVEHLHIATIDRGIEVSQSLFADDFSEKVEIKPKVLGVIEPITLIAKGVERVMDAKLDTGAFRTSIDEEMAHEMGIEEMPQKIFIQSASGQQYRPAAKVTFYLAGKKITTVATLAKRTHLTYPMIVGRRDLKGFFVNPSQDKNFEDSTDPNEDENI